MRYEEIIFLQGDDANDCLDVLNEVGNEKTIDYILTQYDNGKDNYKTDKLPAGSSDDIYETGNYILNYNIPLNYIGLVRKIKGE